MAREFMASEAIDPLGPSSSLQVTRVSNYGFSLVIGDDELRLRYTTFPWFRTSHPERLEDVEWHSPGQLYWPALGIELSEAFVRRLATTESHGTAGEAEGF